MGRVGRQLGVALRGQGASDQLGSKAGGRWGREGPRSGLRGRF